jgi:hypothetical protein
MTNYSVVGYSHRWQQRIVGFSYLFYFGVLSDFL